MNTNINNEKGAALITALFFLIILTMLALSSMNMNIMDEKMASNSQQKNRLFQTAESALVQALGDEDAYNISNTEDNPYNGNGTNLDADMTATYEAIFVQETTMGRSDTPTDQGFSRYFFEMDVNVQNSIGAEKNISAGSWRASKASS